MAAQMIAMQFKITTSCVINDIQRLKKKGVRESIDQAEKIDSILIASHACCSKIFTLLNQKIMHHYQTLSVNQFVEGLIIAVTVCVVGGETKRNSDRVLYILVITEGAPCPHTIDPSQIPPLSFFFY